MEQLLSQAAAELTIRSEVELTLTSLLQDVEQAHTLERSLNSHNELHQCQEQLVALKVRYDEREAAWELDRREKERLGMVLLEEIVKLSAREVEGENSKRELELRLQQLEEEKKRAGTSFSAQQPKQTQNVEGSIERGVIADPGQSVANEEEGGNGKEVNNKIPDEDFGEKQNISDTTNTSEGKKVEGYDVPPAATPEPTEPKIQQFVPQELNETTLMNIVEYSDPLDFMNFAQTNKALLKKVNIMFGMSGGEESNADQQQEIHDTESAAEASVGKTNPQPMQPSALSAAAASTAGQTPPPLPASATDATTNSTSSATPAKSSPKLGGMAGPSHRRQGSGTSVATTGSTGTANPFSQVSSWFGSSDTSSTAPNTTNAPAPSSNPATSAIDTGSEIKLNAAMASSMASKLTPAELSIILRMREKLQKCEMDANKWKAEKEDAVANLASVEAVKGFLVTRVRDTERVVQKQKEEMREVQKKNLEDQEVIVFLDEKVKVLEKTTAEIKSKEAATKQESMDVVNKNEKKARVLSDMLRFEREQMASNEKEWKAAKKVLVKEVKSCRARIVALEAEVDGCRQQNSQLKQGLMSLTQSSGSMSPGGKKNLRKMGRL